MRLSADFKFTEGIDLGPVTSGDTELDCWLLIGGSEDGAVVGGFDNPRGPVHLQQLSIRRNIEIQATHKDNGGIAPSDSRGGCRGGFPLQTVKQPNRCAREKLLALGRDRGSGHRNRTRAAGEGHREGRHAHREPHETSRSRAGHVGCREHKVSVLR